MRTRGVWRLSIGFIRKMIAQLADVLPDAWSTAVERLQSVGVFADERRQFPSSYDVRRFEEDVRAGGYIGGELEIGELEHPRNGVSSVVFDKDKLLSTDAAALAWDNDYQARWHKTVEDRVSDWLIRLRDLQTTMQSWLPANMSIVQRPPIKMHEELMAKFNVPPNQMPSFDIVNDTSRVMRVQPKGLWIVGANGRVDLITRAASYILVDISPPRTAPANWQYYDPNSKRRATALNDSTFVTLLH